MQILNAKVYDPDHGFIQRDIIIEGEYFSDSANNSETIDGAGYTAIPGLIDLHLHGCVQYDFSTADADGLQKIAAYQAKNGVTALCPTTMTLDEETLKKACQRISAYRATAQVQEVKGAQFIGIHLEGPFVSNQKLGAQNPAYAKLPDMGLYRRLQEAAGGMVKLLAVAPELPGAIPLIDMLKDEVVCSIAHTTADYETAMMAFATGAKQITHLYNAMPPFSHRQPGVIGAALDTAACRVELICDGIHVHPSVVRATFKMFGDGRIIMISDSMMATGLQDGIYELGGQPVQVKGNIAKLQAKDTIAGSVTNLMDCLRKAVLEMEIPLHSAVKCASTNPAKALGIDSFYGSIEAGKYADLVLLDDSLAIKQVFLKGKPLL